MAAFGPYALFAITSLAHVAITIYAVFRSRMRAPVPTADREAYIPLGHITVKTPESFNLSPLAGGSTEEGQGGDRHGKAKRRKQHEPIRRRPPGAEGGPRNRTGFVAAVRRS